MGSLFPGPARAGCPDPVPGGQGRPLCPTTRPSPKKHSFKRGSRYSQLLVAVSEEALGGLSLAEGDGDGVGGDVSHGNFT